MVKPLCALSVLLAGGLLATSTFAAPVTYEFSARINYNDASSPCQPSDGIVTGRVTYSQLTDASTSPYVEEYTDHSDMAGFVLDCGQGLVFKTADLDLDLDLDRERVRVSIYDSGRSVEVGAYSYNGSVITTESQPLLSVDSIALFAHSPEAEPGSPESVFHIENDPQMFFSIVEGVEGANWTYLTNTHAELLSLERVAESDGQLPEAGIDIDLLHSSASPLPPGMDFVDITFSVTPPQSWPEPEPLHYWVELKLPTGAMLPVTTFDTLMADPAYPTFADSTIQLEASLPAGTYEFVIFVYSNTYGISSTNFSVETM